MRAFVIADASKRRSKPVGMLFWHPDPRNDQGRFAIELSLAPDKEDLPLSLSFCADKKGRRATAKESEAWVLSRIVPDSRQNISEVLMANGLSRYDAVELLATSNGRSSDDDFLVYEVVMPSNSTSSTVDDLLLHVKKKNQNANVSYAFVDLPGGDSAPHPQSNGTNAAKRIGAIIKSRRHEARLTQKQLAARAGISQVVVSRVESGNGNPTLALLEEIATALDTTLDISLDETETCPLPQTHRTAESRTP